MNHFLKLALPTLLVGALLPTTFAKAQVVGTQQTTAPPNLTEQVRVVASIYTLTSMGPAECRSNPSIAQAVSEFEADHNELMSAVSSSPLFDRVKRILDQKDAVTRSPTQVDKDCSLLFGALKSFESDGGKRNAAHMLEVMRQ